VTTRHCLLCYASAAISAGARIATLFSAFIAALPYSHGAITRHCASALRLTAPYMPHSPFSISRADHSLFCCRLCAALARRAILHSSYAPRACARCPLRSAAPCALAALLRSLQLTMPLIARRAVPTRYLLLFLLAPCPLPPTLHLTTAHCL